MASKTDVTPLSPTGFPTLHEARSGLNPWWFRQRGRRVASRGPREWRDWNPVDFCVRHFCLQPLPRDDARALHFFSSQSWATGGWHLRLRLME